MSMPPQGGWPPPQPGPQPPNQPQYGPPPGYQPYPGQQPYPPQGQWQQPPPPPQKSGATKWLLVAIAVLLVIGVTIGATLLFTRDGDGSSTPPTSDVPSDIASANDTGPVEIITEEPTCNAFLGINDSLADIQANGWADERDGYGPSAEWNSEQRADIEAVATAMRNSADQAVILAKDTPHRVVRELYEQFIAYGRAYAESIADYRPVNNNLGTANVSAGSALVGICKTIENGAARRSIALEATQPPATTTPVTNPAESAIFITSTNKLCAEWTERERRFVDANKPWESIDPNIAAPQWTPEQREIQDAAYQRMADLADQMQEAATQSDNPVWNDFGTLAALYLRAYVAAGDSYTSADSWLSYTGLRLNNLVGSACDAAST